MCGIVGVVDPSRFVPETYPVAVAADLLVKRGPDDVGVWSEAHVGMGHRRLSILDVSPAGHQPMISGSGRYIIVYNGEIYNFRELRGQLRGDEFPWQSDSDTEGVLAAYEKWGKDCVDRFNGMFALAIWDRREQSLFAARDRIGVKPFYYYYSDGVFAFASRPRALLALLNGRSFDLDHESIRLYIDSGYLPFDRSIFRLIKKLPPAHRLIVDRKGLDLERYWDFRGFCPDPAWEGRSENDLLEELDEIISSSVKSRMVSDVPLGAFLSGGIDSSLVVAMMTRHATEPVRTFTIGFDDPLYDESRHSDAVARHLGSEHHCEILRVSDLLQLMPNFLEEFDEPFFDSSAFPTMAVSRLARRTVTVSLSGDGGDELFGGYHYYKIIERLGRIYRWPRMARSTLSWSFHFIPLHTCKLLSGALRQDDVVSAYAFSRSVVKDFENVYEPEFVRHTRGIKELFSDTAKTFPRLSPAEQGMWLDLFYTLPDDYLQKVDVSSMAYSLESRDPLLDHRLVEWAIRLPVKWKLRDGAGKYLLRQLAYKYIPKEMLSRPKQGFQVPIAGWLRGPLMEWAQDRLNDKGLFHGVPLNHKNVLKIWENHKSRKRDAHPVLWAILMLLEFTRNARKLN